MKAHRFVANGLALNCLDYGGEGKPPILFLHGGSAHAHWWDFVAPAFVGDFHVLALDQRGHGESDWADEWAYGSRHYVSDLDQVIDQWGFGAPILVGHSMGAHNVLAYAVRAQRKIARDGRARSTARLPGAGARISAVDRGKTGAPIRVARRGGAQFQGSAARDAGKKGNPRHVALPQLPSSTPTADGSTRSIGAR